MSDETNEEIAVEEEEQPVKKKGKLMLFLLIILVVLGLGGGTGYYFYGHKIMKMLPGRSAASGTVEKEKVKEKEKEHSKKQIPGYIVALEPFIFNVAGNPSKFAKVSIGIEVKDAKIAEETKKILPAIRDKVLLVLGTKPAEAFLDVSQRETVKAELQDKVGSLFKESSELSAVYITDIIIQ
ncbi:MAG TPA: flagellar basal body-associated FliL family protein [Syntrophorhabdaceae bacterium]|jgi:flagellar FliL protein